MTEIKNKHLMRKKITQLLMIAFFAIGANSIQAQSTVMVGGEKMFPMKNIIENAINSKDHTTLVAAVKAAGLVETLQGAGPFTVFAPTNAAFNKLPEGTVATLLKPENKQMLTQVLTYHVVAGKMDSKAIMKAIKKGNGMAELKTVSGGVLVAKMNGEKNITITDEKGNSSNISLYDVYQSNGVIHVIDSVVLPK
ncbi:fasciclin [Roseivirga ehrenbergii]|uniref:Fasciclin n=2 Tax=Roseivirga ehrenbergii (strain DSM 102268 / JCM 13514 / KCTC 12282 / NCIMB 14502 / KMM 6017) TaxID=279360 RepID=A0A150XKB2_ROSEK|nr:fasciclin [Roseivirga ehrenbergii]